MSSLMLTAIESPADGLRRVALAALDDAVARLDHPDVSEEDVHEARKRIKELRAIARLGSNDRSLRAGLRDAARHLASTRDAKAKVEAFDAMRERFAESWGKRRFATVRRALADRLREMTSPDSAAAVTALRFLRPRIDAFDDGGAQFDVIGKRMAKTYRRARRALRAAALRRTPELFHEWRTRAKEHWYHTRLIEAADPVMLAAESKELHDLSHLLGDHHDLVVLRETLRSNAPDLGSPRLLRELDAFIGKRMSELEDEAETIGSRVFAEKPRAWLRRVGAYWDIWRSAESRPRRGPKQSGARRPRAATA